MERRIDSVGLGVYGDMDKG